MITATAAGAKGRWTQHTETLVPNPGATRVAAPCLRQRSAALIVYPPGDRVTTGVNQPGRPGPHRGHGAHRRGPLAEAYQADRQFAAARDVWLYRGGRGSRCLALVVRR